jgi:hypothetical protein
MPDRPILFSAPMVHALLAGTKTQTRRVLKVPGIMGGRYPIYPPEEAIELEAGEFRSGVFHYASTGALSGPYSIGFAVGDRLYVREEYYQHGHWEPVIAGKTKGGRQKWYFAGDNSMVTFEPPADFLTSRSKPFPGLPRWYKRLGRFMPRRYSRLTLTVTDVRVERLQDISEADAIAEGIGRDMIPDGLIPGGNTGFGFADCSGFDTAKSAYSALWDSINGTGAWAGNPWVAAVSFEVRSGNIDD